MANATPAEAEATDLQRTFFAYLHALACFYHYIWPLTMGSPVDVHTGTAFLSLAMVFAVLWRPHDLRALVGLCVAQILDVAFYMPVVPNHWLLTAVADATLLLSFAVTRGAPDTLSRLREPMAWGIAIFYLYTGIWKLTDQWFDPAVSCGALAWNRQAEQFGLPHDGVGVMVAIYATLIIELLGPVGLLWRKTRGVVTALFVAFHLVLGLDIIQNFLNFSSVMMALLVLQLDASAFRRVAHLVPAMRTLGKVWIGLMTVLVALAAFPDQHVVFHPIRWLAWVGHALTTLGLYVLLAGGSFPTRSALPASWAFLVVVVLNGAAPWLGLKTRNSWQMYSNLRMEADHSNHLFLPPSLDLLGYLAEEPVTVHEVSVPDLQKQWGIEGAQITWFMFHNLLADHPDASVHFTRGGVDRRVARVGDDAEIMDARSPWLMRKLVWFRPLGPPVADKCQW